MNDLPPSLWSVFDFMDLTQIMRQSNGTAFASLLNKINTETPEPNSVKDHILQSREISISEDDPAYLDDVMDIYARNKYAAEINEKVLNSCSGNFIYFHSKRHNERVKHKAFQCNNARSL